MSKDFFDEPEDGITSKGKKSTDGKEINSSKYVNIKPTLAEQAIEDLCETIFNIDKMTMTDGYVVDTTDLLASVVNESFDDFYNDLPVDLREYADEIFETLSLYIEEIDMYDMINESRVMSLAARRKKSMLIRRHKAKILSAKKRASRRRAGTDQILRRASRKARLAIKKKLTGSKSYNSMSPSEKLAVDKRLENIPQSVFKRATLKAIPKVKEAETHRLQNMNRSKDDKKNTTKQIKTQSSDQKKTNKIGAITQNKPNTVKSIKESIDINNIFEGEYIATKSDLPKK